MSMLCKQGKSDCKLTAMVRVTNKDDPQEAAYYLCALHLDTEIDGVKIYKTSEMKMEVLLTT